MKYLKITTTVLLLLSCVNVYAYSWVYQLIQIENRNKYNLDVYAQCTLDLVTSTPGGENDVPTQAQTFDSYVWGVPALPRDDYTPESGSPSITDIIKPHTTSTYKLAGMDIPGGGCMVYIRPEDPASGTKNSGGIYINPAFEILTSISKNPKGNNVEMFYMLGTKSSDSSKFHKVVFDDGSDHNLANFTVDYPANTATDINKHAIKIIVMPLDYPQPAGYTGLLGCVTSENASGYDHSCPAKPSTVYWKAVNSN